MFRCLLLSFLWLALLINSTYAQETLLTSQYAEVLNNLNNNTIGTYGEVSTKHLNLLTGNMPNLVDLSVTTNYPKATIINLANFEKFSTLMFVIAVAIVTFTIVDTVAKTSLEGEFMGRKYPKYFLLIRSIAGITLFLPTANGYTVLQGIISYVALQGIALANAGWSSLAATMLMYNGGIGNALIANSNMETQFGNQYRNEQAVSIANNLFQIEKDEVDKLIYTSSDSSSIESDSAAINAALNYALQMNAVSMYCMLQSIQNSGISDYNEIQSTFNENINNMINGIMSNNNNSINYAYSYTYNNINYDCGQYNLALNSTYASGLRALFVDGIRTLSSRVLPLTKISQDNITDNNYQQLATSLVNISLEWAYQITLLNANENASNNAKTSGLNKPTMTDLLDGGWAMMANNYLFYTNKLNEYAYQLNVNNPSPSMADLNLMSISNNEDNKDVVEKYNTFSKDLMTQTGSYYTTELLNFKEVTNNNDQKNYCSYNKDSCNNINQYVFNYDGGGPAIGSATSSLYSSFKSQIPNVNHVKTFVEIGSESSACSIPFSPPENCNATNSGVSAGIGPLDYKANIGILFGAMAIITMGATVGFFKVIGPMIFMAIALPFAGAAVVANFTDLNAIFNDPDSLYPRSLAWDIQSYTYFLVKAWYDTIIYNQVSMFMNPIKSLSAFGMRVMSYSIGFIFRIGIDTFASIFSTGFDLLMRRVYMEIGLSIAGMYSSQFAEWGYRYFRSHMGNGLAFSIWQVSWFLGMFRTPGIPIPAPPGIMCNFFNYLCIPFIFPIIIPMHLIIGGILMGIGYGLMIVKMAITVAKLFDITDMLLQVKNFITTRYNPVYFAIAVPMIVLSSTFAIIIPIYPIMIYTLCVLSYYLVYLEAIVAAPLILIGIVIPDGHAVLGKADKLLQLLLVVYIRPLLTVIGFVMANVTASLSVIAMYETAIPMLNAQIGAWAQGYVMVSTNGVGSNQANSMVTACVTVLAMYMFIYLYYQIILYSYSLIYKVPNAVNKYMGIPASASEQEEMARMEDIAEQFKSMTNNIASAGTDSASKSEEGAAAIDPVSISKKQKQGAAADAKTSEESGSIVSKRES